jgi:hypothetical protein
MRDSMIEDVRGAARSASVATALVLAACATDPGAGEAPFCEPVAAGDLAEPLVSYRARIQGDYLVVEAAHDPGWHSYALDTDVRAAEKLAGEEPLGGELPTRVTVRGATVAGPWLQTPPEDLSEPDIQWYSWGFRGTATFAVKLRDVGTEPVVVAVEGQVCDENGCRGIDVELVVDPESQRAAAAFDARGLVEARVSESGAGSHR